MTRTIQPDGVAHVRRRLEEAVELALRALDAIDGDPDLEPTGDDEPSLGALNVEAADLDQGGWAFDGYTFAPDLEPSLCGLDGYGAGRFTDCLDREHEHDGREPECEDEGAQCEGGGGDDACEDEGSQCDDEGAITGDDEPWLNPATGRGSDDFRDLEVDRSDEPDAQGANVWAQA